MLLRPSRSLLAVRAFILAPPVCIASAPFDFVPSVLSCDKTPSHCRSQRSRPRGLVAHYSTTDTDQKPVPYALTAAARSFEEQVQRGELDFLPQAYEHLRQIFLEAQRRGLSPADADASILSEDVVKRVISLLTTSSQREHATLHLAIFSDLRSIFRIHAEVVHPLEFTAQIFQEHLHAGTLNTLPHIYDHLQHLADALPDPRTAFTSEAAAWRAVSWMQRLTGGQQTDLLPRILHDLPRLFGLQPTLAHHQLVVKGFLARDMPDEAWAWLMKMERQEENAELPTLWLKPSTAQYDLLLKYFAKRGDVVSVRMLLAQMPAYAAPSQLSYNLLLAAILAKPAPALSQREIVEAAVEELSLKGHSVHLKTLGGVMGRGSLASWVPREVFDVLRAAQARSNARDRGPRNTAHDHGGKFPNGVEADKIWGAGSADASSRVSNMPALDVEAAPESYDSPPNAIPLSVFSEGIEEAHVSHQPPLPEHGIPHVSVSTAPLLDAARDGDRAVGSGVDNDMGHHEVPTGAPSLNTEERLEDSDQYLRSKRMLKVVRRKNSTPSVDLSTPNHQPPIDVSYVEDGGTIDTAKEPPETSLEKYPLSEQPRRKQITKLPQDFPEMPIKLPEPPELQQVDSGESGVAHCANPEQKIDEASLDFTAHLSRSTSLPTLLPGRRATLKSEARSESATSGASVSPKESFTPKCTTNGTNNDRVRRNYSRLLHNALRRGDFREASKIYAQLTAVMGPDVEFGGTMIRALCRGHLLKPPPRPHVMQALRIYRSLVQVENRVAANGFFDGASVENRHHTRIRINVYTNMLRALSIPAPANASSRDYGQEIHEEYATFVTELLADMQARGLRPDDRTLISILLLRFRAAKTHEEAFNHYKSLVADNTHSLESAPPHKLGDQSFLGLSEYRSILYGFAKLSFPDAPIAPAELWLSIADDMRASGHNMTVEDYTRFLARISDIRKTPLAVPRPSVGIPLANDEEDRMQSIYACIKHVHRRLVLDANISPDAYLLNTLMNVYQHVGAFQDALRVFNTILVSGRMDNVTPIIIFDACGHAGRQRVAYMIWCMLVAKGWRFDKRALDTWVECLSRSNIEAACRFVCVYMGRENAGYLSDGDTRPDVQTCLILLKLSWLHGQNAVVKEKIRAHLPHIWAKLTERHG